MKKEVLLSGIAFALAVMAVAVANLAGAIYGGAAGIGSLIATAFYVGIVTGLLIFGRKNPVLKKIGFVWSLLSFLSALWSLLMRLLHSGFVISALISVLSSVPFYGLRYRLDWTVTYALAAGVSLVWLVWSGAVLGRKS